MYANTTSFDDLPKMQNRTLAECNGDTISVGSIALFGCGGFFFLLTFLFWIFTFCRARRLKRGIGRPLPLTPPVTTLDVQASGEYIDLQDSVSKYESLDVSAGVSKPEAPRYVPRDAMHETFDGSRMPQTEAPKPPNYPPQFTPIEKKCNDHLGSQRKTNNEENDSGLINKGCHDTDKHDNRSIACSYEMSKQTESRTYEQHSIPEQRPLKKE